MLKATKSNMDAVGATTEEGFIDALMAKISTLENQATATSALKTENATLTAQVKELAGKVDAFKPGMSADEIKAIAGAEASKVAGQAVAATGGKPVQGINVTETSSTADPVAALVAAGKYEEAWAADAKTLQCDFSTAKSYAAYMQGVKSGVIR